MRKNYNKIPSIATAKVELIEGRFLKVGYIKTISKEDIINGEYTHLNISVIDGEIRYDENVIPDPNRGRYSKYNIFGRTIVRKDFPKVTKSFIRDIYPYGNTNASTVTAVFTREVWQKDIFLPEHIGININVRNETEENVTILFEVDKTLDKNIDCFEGELLTCINLSQENVGDFDIYAENSIPEEQIIRDFQVGWEILPPGTVNRDYVEQSFPKKSPSERAAILERVNFVYSLSPLATFRGTNSFNYYFGAQFANDVVILENANLGNAIYIFYSDWETLSQLSRSQLIRMNSTQVERIMHKGQWQAHVRHILKLKGCI